MAHAGGRPTKYSPAMVAKAKAYYQRCLRAKDSTGKQVIRIPWVEELALELDIDDDTIVEWCKDDDKKEFSATIKKLNTLQQLRLSQRTLGKNPAGSIFLLKVNHNKKETNIVENYGDSKQDEQIDQIQSIISTLSSDAKSQHNQPN